MTYPSGTLYPSTSLYPLGPVAPVAPVPLPPQEQPGRARWAWSAGPWNGLPTSSLSHAQSRSLKFQLRGSHSASFTMDGTADEAARISELVNDVWVTRNGQCLFRGRVGPTSDDCDGSKHTVNFSAGDYRSLLQRRQLWDNDPLSFTNVDQASIAWQLINATQNQSGGKLGIVNGANTTGVVQVSFTPPETVAAQAILARLNSGGNVFEDFSWYGMPAIVGVYNDDLSAAFFKATSANWPAVSQAQTWLTQYIADNPAINTFVPSVPYNASVQRTIAYAAGQSIGEAINALALMDAGFDWDITPHLGVPVMTFDVWPSRGSSRGRPLNYPGNIASFQRQFDPGTYANAVRETGNTGLAAARVEASDIATRDEGRWDAQLGDTSLLDAASVSARATKDLADRQTPTPVYTLTLRPGEWGGPADIWLGDTVIVDIESGRIATQGAQYRVMEINVDLDDSDNETVKIVTGVLDPSRRFSTASILRRLTTLERR